MDQGAAVYRMGWRGPPPKILQSFTNQRAALQPKSPQAATDLARQELKGEAHFKPEATKSYNRQKKRTISDRCRLLNELTFDIFITNLKCECLYS